jgi:CheY-like chemotaxis protein
MIAVTDTGVGMDRETQARVFEPFFTTKGEAGTGLGLATVYGIVKQSGGSIWVYSEVGQGTTFKVYLPVVEETPMPRPAGGGDIVGGSETILLVEDDPSVRRLAERVLTGAGYRVLAAEGGQIALDLADRHEGPIHLLLTDLVLPDVRGGELAERMAARWPQTRILFMSGYTDPPLLPRPLREQRASLVHKPFSKADLLRQVRQALGPEGAS